MPLFGFEKTALFDMTNHWNGGFLFEKDFIDSKLFRRYCSKMERIARDYLKDAVLSTNDAALRSSGLSPIIKSFFTMVFDEDYAVREGDRLNDVDWRYNLIPLTRVNPLDMRSSDEMVLKGWYLAFNEPDVWDSVYDGCFIYACLHYLHGKYIALKDITRENFCVKALPESVSDVMLFVKCLINMMWVGMYTTFVWTQQDRAGDILESDLKQAEINKLQDDNRELREKLDNMNENVIPSYERKITELKREHEINVSSRVSDYRSRIDDDLAAERKKFRQTETELEQLKGKYQELEEQLKIISESEDDDDNAAPTDVTLNYESRIVFIASPPPNGRVEGTYKRLMQRFPNSRFINSADDIQPGADCYVMLTRYMNHHSLYNSSHDLLLRRRYPYIHSASQNIDRIANDIFSKTRYVDQ